MGGLRKPGPCRPSRRRGLARLLASGLLLSCLCGTTGFAADWGRWSPYPSLPGLFEERCSRCHGGAGTFAPAHLTFEQGVLRTGRSGKALQDFLRGHPGQLDEAERTAMVATLTMIVTAGGQFHQRCAVCHGHAEAFAAGRLVIRDGLLLGRYSGRDIEAFLPRHGRLDAEGAAFFGAVLRRFARKEPRP